MVIVHSDVSLSLSLSLSFSRSLARSLSLSAGMEGLPVVTNQELMACVLQPLPERRPDGSASIVGKDVEARVGLRVRLLPPLVSQVAKH